jgi:hypothetical protein
MKRKYSYLFSVLLVLLVAVIVVPGCISPLRRGLSLRSALLSAAADSTSIKVVEHSDRFDPQFKAEREYKEKIYRTVTLSADDVSRLCKAFSLSCDDSGTTHTECNFVPHHRVEFLRRDGKVTILEICFHCGEIEFDGGRQRIMPVGWPSSLQSFIVSLGMSPIPKE